MNRLHTVDGKRADKDHALLSIRSALFCTILLSVFSGTAIANRPSVDEGDDPDEPEATQSAVENMMRLDQQTGDVLNMPAEEIEPGETIRIKLLDFPRRGMSMKKVENEYGPPIQISDTVGKPPITRWTYPDRVVYFEYSTVIHVVAR